MNTKEKENLIGIVNATIHFEIEKQKCRYCSETQSYIWLSQIESNLQSTITDILKKLITEDKDEKTTP